MNHYTDSYLTKEQTTPHYFVSINLQSCLLFFIKFTASPTKLFHLDEVTTQQDSTAD